MKRSVSVPRKTVALVLLALGFFLIASEAEAISRYSSTSMSCGEIRATIRAEGAAILRWRSSRDASRPLYGRFVANRGYCDPGERTETRFIPSADRRSCPVNECKRFDPDDDFLFPLLRHR